MGSGSKALLTTMIQLGTILEMYSDMLAERDAYFINSVLNCV